MKRYAVIREEDGKQYMKDEDVIQAENYQQAENKLLIGKLEGKQNHNARIQGEIVAEIEVKE